MKKTTRITIQVLIHAVAVMAFLIWSNALVLCASSIFTMATIGIDMIKDATKKPRTIREGYKRISVEVPEYLHYKVKAFANETNLTMTSLIKLTLSNITIFHILEWKNSENENLNNSNNCIPNVHDVKDIQPSRDSDER